ncbi:hypothetical protein N9L68_06355, partial [bacterium]|nr:hypothetical protein [bacterium]
MINIDLMSLSMVDKMCCIRSMITIMIIMFWFVISLFLSSFYYYAYRFTHGCHGILCVRISWLPSPFPSDAGHNKNNEA